MMKYLLAAATAIAMVASAAAQTMDDTDNNNNKEYWYECSVTQVTPRDQDKDPGYKVNLYFFADGEQLFKRVVHTTRSGAQYNRVNQYTVKDENNIIDKNGVNVWFGQSIKSPGIYMMGMFGKTKDGKLVYNEMLWRDKNITKKPAMVLNSVCHII
jgi:hypothetical protein